jgi:hypothetical protein
MRLKIKDIGITFVNNSGMKLKYFLFIVLLTSLTAVAQTDGAVVINKGQGAAKTGGLVYNKEFSVGGKITTTGWGVLGEYARKLDQDRKRLLYFELMFMKHPKELKKVNEYNFAFSFDSPRPFIYAKENSFFNAKAAYGHRILIGEKAEKSGFEINFNYVAGPSLGMTKPYYLEILYEEDGDTYKVSEKYGPETANLFLDATSIYGYSGFSKGLSEISIIPGAFAKTGLSFDWASYDEYVKSLEAGIGAEIYVKDVPMMILENNKPYFVYLYLSLQLGKKW